eukprot:5934457-Ditylum_brightwellii.AAC.1
MSSTMMISPIHDLTFLASINLRNNLLLQTLVILFLLHKKYAEMCTSSSNTAANIASASKAVRSQKSEEEVEKGETSAAASYNYNE